MPLKLLETLQLMVSHLALDYQNLCGGFILLLTVPEHGPLGRQLSIFFKIIHTSLFK